MKRSASTTTLVLAAAAGGILLAATLHAHPLPPTPAEMSHRVTTWMANGGSHDLGVLGNDMANVNSDRASQDFEGFFYDCTSLDSDVSTILGHKALPDGNMQYHWVASLNHLQRSATACLAGNFDLQDAELIMASTEVQAVRNRMSELGVTGV